MLEFKIIQELKPNEELLEIIKNYNYTIKNGKIKHLMVTNLQFIEPTENDEKVNHVIDMIKDMDLENKLRLAIYMYDNCSHTNLEYDKKEIYKHFDKMLKEINIEYRITTVNFANYPYTIFVSSKIMEMDSAQQNKVALYLFNNIKKCKNIDNREQMF